MSEEDFRLCFSGKIAQVYNGFQYDLVDRTQDFTKNVEIRKKIQLQDYDGQADLQTILDPNMIGLRLPQQDLDHLKDFSKYRQFIINPLLSYRSRYNF